MAKNNTQFLRVSHLFKLQNNTKEPKSSKCCTKQPNKTAQPKAFFLPLSPGAGGWSLKRSLKKGLILKICLFWGYFSTQNKTLVWNKNYYVLTGYFSCQNKLLDWNENKINEKY